jgi:hypothetical protein
MEDHHSAIADNPARRSPWDKEISSAQSRRCVEVTSGRSELSCRLRVASGISRCSTSRSTASCAAAT